MIALRIFTAFSVSAILLLGETVFAEPRLDGLEPVTQKECNERRLLRFRQLWHMYEARNNYFSRPAEEQMQLRSVMDRTWYPQVSRKSFQETTELLLTDGQELRKRLEAEARSKTNPQNAQAAQRNLEYLNDKLTARVTDCSAFFGSRRDWDREFERLGAMPVPPPAAGESAAKPVTAAVPAVERPAPVSETRRPFIRMIIVNDDEESSTSR